MTWFRRMDDGYETTVDMEWPDLGLVILAGYRFNVSVPKRWRWFVDPHDPRYFEAALLPVWISTNFRDMMRGHMQT